jgi:glycerophosphoryl diester phosphodiesterase
MPDDDRKELRRIVKEAHRQGRLVRFWGAPDNIATWRQLRAASVDLINTDDLKGAQKFLLTERSAEHE